MSPLKLIKFFYIVHRTNSLTMPELIKSDAEVQWEGWW